MDETTGRCVACKKEFYVPPSRGKKKIPRFDSLGCAKKYERTKKQIRKPRA